MHYLTNFFKILILILIFISIILFYCYIAKIIIPYINRSIYLVMLNICTHTIYWQYPYMKAARAARVGWKWPIDRALIQVFQTSFKLKYYLQLINI